MKEKELLNGVRWKVIEVLAQEGSMTATDLAKKTNTSLPAISQATSLLEAYKYISAKALPRGSPGKPKTIYTLNKETVHIALCTHGVAKQFSFSPSAMHAATLRAFQLPTDDQDWIIQLLWSYRNILSTVDAIAYVRSDEEETHILVLTSDTEKYRKQYSHITLKTDDASRKIVSWSHTIREAKEGLDNNEEYFINLFEKPIVLYDPKNVMPRG